MILSRLRNLWRLSEFEPRKLGSEPLQSGTVVAQIIKRPQVAQFFPRNVEKPIDKVIKAANSTP